MIRFAPFHAFLYDFFVASWTPAHRRKVNHEASEWKASSEKWRVPGCGMAIWKFLPLASSADFHLANAATSVDNRKQLSWSWLKTGLLSNLGQRRNDTFARFIRFEPVYETIFNEKFYNNNNFLRSDMGLRNFNRINVKWETEWNCKL